MNPQGLATWVQSNGKIENMIEVQLYGKIGIIIKGQTKRITFLNNTLWYTISKQNLIRKFVLMFFKSDQILSQIWYFIQLPEKGTVSGTSRYCQLLQGNKGENVCWRICQINLNILRTYLLKVKKGTSSEIHIQNSLPWKRFLHSNWFVNRFSILIVKTKTVLAHQEGQLV